MLRRAQHDPYFNYVMGSRKAEEFCLKLFCVKINAVFFWKTKQFGLAFFVYNQVTYLLHFNKRVTTAQPQVEQNSYAYI